MQVLNVEGFEKRVVYGASKAYVGQLEEGDQYPELNDVIAVSICDFVLWPDGEGGPAVPLVSHWRMQEQHGGRRGLGQVQYVFVELPKLPLDRPPTDEPEEWAYIFRQAPALSAPPPFVQTPGPRAALEVARTALFSHAEWDAYDRARIAEQDARGALAFAERRGELRGRREAVRMLARVAGIGLSQEDEVRIDGCDEAATLERWIANGRGARDATDLFR
jgi:predicted transposase/invertase (TIGR01784 family)